MDGQQTPFSNATFLGSEQRLARYVGRPVRRFLDIEAAGGVVLLVATVAALIWANSPWSDSYFDLWHTSFELSIGDYEFGGGHELDLELLVNDALMAIFFFVVGLEIKRELVAGQLRDRRAATLPAIAALGGMVVPALIFFAFNTSGDGSRGWGIPMATDIAFAVGIVSLLGSRVSRSLKVFLLTLAIVDDIGAIAVIAIFYTDDLSVAWLLTAAGLTVLIWVLRQLRVWYIPLYVVLGAALWLATFESGVHATIAGVVLGLITPAEPLMNASEAGRWAEWLRNKGEQLFAVDVRYAAFHMRESVSVAERLEIAIHPVTSFVIIPVFALANAGVSLSGDKISEAATSSVTIGVALGLVVGKSLGIFSFTYLAGRTRFATVPREMGNGQLLGLAMVAGIGFTVALFITGLAYDDVLLQDDAKIGILAASFVAAVGGLYILARSTGTRDEEKPEVERREPEPVAAG